MMVRVVNASGLPPANRSWDAFVWGRLVMGIELISDRDVADESSSAKGYD